MRDHSRPFAAFVLCLSVLLSPTYSVAQQDRPAGEALPRQSDWFLSTGDWHKDSQLYVREFGDGDETVVVLHGGWGAEHIGLIDAVRDLEHEYHFVLYDQRGSLRSPGPDASITYDRRGSTTYREARARIAAGGRSQKTK